MTRMIRFASGVNLAAAIHVAISTVLCFVSCYAAFAENGLDTPRDETPNFILVLADDLGWSDLRCYGNEFHETPHIDGLAAGGMRFTEAYAAAPVCSPTRASLLTGRYPATLNLTDWLPGFQRPWAKASMPRIQEGLAPGEFTITEALQSRGYVSASIGKWHLGKVPFYPVKHGFDVDFAGHHSGRPGSYFFPYGIPTISERSTREYLTDRLADEAIRFIEQNSNKPFFLYWSHFAVHRPVEAPAPIVEKYELKATKQSARRNPIYAAMLESLDQAVGRVLKRLDELKLADRTVVIFYSDNGGFSPATSNAPLKDGKGSPYEGGLRVPLIVRWPGVIAPGRVSTTPITTPDLFPTITQMAGAAIDRPLDGESLLPLLKGTGDLNRDDIFWHYPHYYPNAAKLKHVEEAFSNPWRRGWRMPFSAVRQGRYKLIEFLVEDRVELYDLEKDVSESTDLAASMPGKATQLQRRLEQWRGRVGAKMPSPNPDADPERADRWTVTGN